MKSGMTIAKWKLFYLMILQKQACAASRTAWRQDPRWLADIVGQEMASCGASLMRTGQIMATARGTECFQDSTLV